MKKYVLRAMAIGVLCSASVALSGCAEMMKGISGAASMALTQKTSNLALASVQASYVTGLYTRDTQEVGAEILGNLWVPGSNALMVSFLKNRGVGFYEIEGDIGWRNAGSKDALKPLQYVMSGSYVAVLPGADKTPKEVVVTTLTGQTTRFTLKPTSTVEIARVNGQSANAVIDLNKDLTLDLNMPRANTGQIRVSLLSTVMTNRAFVDLGVFKAKSRIVIPAAAFKHPSVSASVAGVVGFDKGANYLRVEHFDTHGSELQTNKETAALLNLSQSWSTLPVQVTGEASDISSLQTKGEFQSGGKTFHYNAHKANAFYSPPLKIGKVFGLGSLTLSGRLFSQETSTSESTPYYANYRTITTTTVTKAFPELPNGHWDRLLEALANDIEQMLKRRGIQMKRTAVIKQASAYAELEVPEVQNNKYAIQRSYQGGSYLTPQSVGAIVNSASSTFAYDRPLARVMRQTQSNGLMAMHLDLQVATDDKDKIVLIPNLKYVIHGPTNGFVVSTTYAQGTVYGSGIPFSTADLQKKPAALARVVQTEALVKGLEMGLNSVEQEAAAAGYAAIWALH